MRRSDSQSIYTLALKRTHRAPVDGAVAANGDGHAEGEEGEVEVGVLGPRDPFNCPQLYRRLQGMLE